MKFKIIRTLILSSLSFAATLLLFASEVRASEEVAPTPESLSHVKVPDSEVAPTPLNLISTASPESEPSTAPTPASLQKPLQKEVVTAPTPASLQKPLPAAVAAGAATAPTQKLRRKIFAGGSNSLVARAVGHAEGTRTATGGYTRAYGGHIDPGNDVSNLGSFSFQHCREARYNCSTPDQADRHQLQRLQRQAKQLRQRAAALGVTMTLEEELNAIDLVNQSPRAALARKKAYPERLAQAKQKGLQGHKAILEGRVWAYWDGDRGRWAAPGLWRNRKPGETYQQVITRDQRRRLKAVSKVLHYQQQKNDSQLEQRIDQILAQ